AARWNRPGRPPRCGRRWPGGRTPAASRPGGESPPPRGENPRRAPRVSRRASPREGGGESPCPSDTSATNDSAWVPLPHALRLPDADGFGRRGRRGKGYWPGRVQAKGGGRSASQLETSTRLDGERPSRVSLSVPRS